MNNQKFIKIFVCIVLLWSNLRLSAESPPVPAKSGGGSHGPGAPSDTPIDMYQFYLVVAAVALILFFAYRYRAKLSKI